tara:strand:- start:9021 stop:9452 length:432 start_codon:yes stop_codon:yes gene_type:complete
MSLVGFHGCTNDWRILENQDAVLGLADIEHLLTPNRISIVEHGEICWRGIEHIHSNWGDVNKIDKVDIDYPCILGINIKNPCKYKYRLIDGNHRMLKMNKQGITKSKFYVLTLEDFQQYLQIFDKEYLKFWEDILLQRNLNEN